MRPLVTTHKLHRVTITIKDDFFAKLLDKWDLGLGLKTRRGDVKSVKRKVTPKELQHNISSHMMGIYPGTYGTSTTGWGPLAGQQYAQWPQFHSGGILPFDVEILVEIDNSVTPEELNEEIVATRWENLMKLHLGDPIPFEMCVDVRIVPVNGVHYKFLIGEPETNNS